MNQKRQLYEYLRNTGILADVVPVTLVDPFYQSPGETNLLADLTSIGAGARAISTLIVPSDETWLLLAAGGRMTMNAATSINNQSWLNLYFELSRNPGQGIPLSDTVQLHNTVAGVAGISHTFQTQAKIFAPIYLESGSVIALEAFNNAGSPGDLHLHALVATVGKSIR